MDVTAGNGRTRRVGGLDGVRGLAIAAVLAYHAFPGAVPGGFLGVEVFFVLSGFLLAGLLTEEHRRTGHLSFERYARRRFARVLPGLVFALLGVVLMARYLVPEDAHRVPADALASLAGLTNWHLIQSGSSYFSELGRPSLVRHLWSLAIEMQFYVVCPFLVALLVRLRRRTAVVLLVAGIAASAIVMTVLAGGADSSRAYFGTDTRIGALLCGVALAFVMSGRGDRPPDRNAVRARRLGLTSAAVLLMLVLLVDEQSRFLYPAGFVLCRLATVGLILCAGTPSRVSAALSWSPLRWLGQRSYGIYLWHWPLLAIMRPGIDVGWSPWVARTSAVAAACVLGELSFRLVEMPFLRPRRSFSADVVAVRSALRWSVVGAALTGTGLVAAFLPSVDPIAASIGRGEEVVASQEAPASSLVSDSAPVPAAPEPPVTTVPAPAAAPPPAPPVPPAPAPVPVTAIGDSVMLGSAGGLRDRLGPASFVDAKVNRQYAEGVALARRLRDQGQLGQVVFVHLGTNGPPRADQIDSMMEALAGVEHVRFVTVRVNRRWEAATNQALLDGAARHAPQVQIVDWYGTSAGHREWFQSDGTHLKGPGIEAYANLLAAAMPPPPPPSSPRPHVA